jgi:hypothetical protein
MDPSDGYVQQRLIPITPGIILGPDVLIGILDALLQGRHVLPVLPMLVPEIPGVDAGEDDAGDHHAVVGELVLMGFGKGGHG